MTSLPQSPWSLSSEAPPTEFIAEIQAITGQPSQQLATLLWRRGWRDPAELRGWLTPKTYLPQSPWALGEELRYAIDRLVLARSTQEKVAIWGDFDADGVTATAVLWDGLGQFFERPTQLTYFIPNRLTDSHGLSIAGIDRLYAEGYRLIVTCDTGSTSLTEIHYARDLGIDVIVTDHHTLPPDRPPVTAIVNPRYLDPAHPLATLSGVAVAYKLVEALYETLPDIPEKPLAHLLDLVAIGLIADLVELKGDCRYLAQQGIEQLRRQADRLTMTRPGLFHLLDFCKRTGDRATDIAFGIGPRINAVSRIQGDAQFCVELLTTQDDRRGRELAEATELANTRRRALQKEVADQVLTQVQTLDLSTTQVIVLGDEQWHLGVLGLVASQIAQEYSRPTILMSFQEGIARGSARSALGIDLYELVQDQAHLLDRFGGHPYAAGLKLPVENVPLLAEAINQRSRQQLGDRPPEKVLQADLQVTVQDLGLNLYRELRWIEPCGMGNPPPRLLLRQVWFEQATHRNLKDRRGGKVSYIRTTFQLCDRTCPAGIPGSWWGHYKDELPAQPCDVLVELENNVSASRYEVRLIAVQATESAIRPASAAIDWLEDWRFLSDRAISDSATADYLVMHTCPSSWDEVRVWLRRAYHAGQKLAIAYRPPSNTAAASVWITLIGLAKYLSRTGILAPPQQLLDRLNIQAPTLKIGLQTLQQLGFSIHSSSEGIGIRWDTALVHPETIDPKTLQTLSTPFMQALQEERFRQQYFAQLPFSTLQTIAEQILGLESDR